MAEGAQLRTVKTISPLDKEDAILNDLKRRAKAERFAKMTVIFLIRDGVIVDGEIESIKPKLG